MNYIIHTPSATCLKKEILDRVSKKADARSTTDRLLPEGRKNGREIATWQVAETDGNGQVLVHTTNQWADKGCIALKQVLGSNELQVRFHYWDSCEDRNNGDDKIMFGRFTELLLFHSSFFLTR